MTTPAQEIAAGLTLGQLRRELAHLIAMADTAERPKPTRINPPGHSMPGHEWVVDEDWYGQPTRNYTWTIRAVDDPGGVGSVFVSTPDCTSPGEDFAPITPTDARRVALALLAAADRADHIALDIPRLEDHRPA